jgi:CheY-like chemotaxis protein
MPRVLVLDDDEGIRESLGWAVTEFGYRAELAATAQEEVRALLAAPEPMVVLFDYFMPEQTGEDFVRTAQSAVPFADRHAYICITASPDRLPASLRDWLAQRGAPIIGKPFDLDELRTVMAREALRLPAAH